MKKICLKKTKHTIKSIEYNKTCPYCLCIYQSSNTTNECNNCRKIRSFTSNHFLFSFALHTLLQNLIDKKKTKITYAEILKLEENLLEIVENCLHIDYCLQNLTLYIKIPSVEPSFVFDDVISDIKQIMNLLAKKVMDLNDNILQQIMKEIKIKFIETCSNFQNMQKITNITNINSLQTIQKPSCRYTNRKILQKKFNEYFDFFNDC